MGFKRITKPAPNYNREGHRPNVERLTNMKKTIAILALAALAITSTKAGVIVGVTIGTPAPPPVIVAPAPVFVAPAAVVIPPPMPAPMVEVVPVCPAAGYIWVGGSWGWCNSRWAWTRGHWGPPPRWGYGHRTWYQAPPHGGHHYGYHGGYSHR